MTPSIIQSTNFINFFFLIYLDYINYMIPFLNELSISKQTYLFLLIEWFTLDFSSPPYKDYVNNFESFKVFLWVVLTLLHPNILLLLISYSRTSMIFIEWFCLLWVSFTFELYIFLAFFSTIDFVTSMFLDTNLVRLAINYLLLMLVPDPCFLMNASTSWTKSSLTQH